MPGHADTYTKTLYMGVRTPITYTSKLGEDIRANSKILSSTMKPMDPNQHYLTSLGFPEFKLTLFGWAVISFITYM
jgi:hypothetical protein